jgi:DNA-binding MarR family transcriptional regulator
MSNDPLPHLGRLLRSALRSFEDALTEELNERGDPGIRPAHSAVFAHLHQGPATASELARRAGMTRQSMGELVADLEAKGYVERRPDPTNRRRRVVALTKSGQRVDRVADAVIAAIERRYACELGRDGFAALKDALARVAAREESDGSRPLTPTAS